MNKVTKNTSIIPESLSACKHKIKDALLEKGEHNFSNYFYANKTVKKKLSEIYNDKCAFCESNTTAGAVLQVEHFRPKAKVNEDNLHEGYYWLGYEWTNLLYACSACNSAKSNYFPLDKNGVRIYKPPIYNNELDINKCKYYDLELLNEKPLLLNPEECDFEPELHLEILPNGIIEGKTERGKMTIEKCKLNRPNLHYARKYVIDNILNLIMLDFVRYNENKINYEQLKYGVQKEIEKIIERIIDNQTYTLLAKFMLKNFEIFFIKRFQNKEQFILKKIFIEILNTI